MSEAFLQGLCLRAYAAPFSDAGVVQQIHGAGEEGVGSHGPVPEEMPDGPLHGDKLRGQHGAAGVPESEDTSAQGVQGAGAERAMLNGVVLRLQAAPGLQREGGAAQLHADPGQRG